MQTLGFQMLHPVLDCSQVLLSEDAVCKLSGFVSEQNAKERIKHEKQKVIINNVCLYNKFCGIYSKSDVKCHAFCLTSDANHITDYQDWLEVFSRNKAAWWTGPAIQCLVSRDTAVANLLMGCVCYWIIIWICITLNNVQTRYGHIIGN